MDGDGHNDAVICGKGGLYIFYYRGLPLMEKPAHRLPPESTYPTWEEWNPIPVPPRPEEIPLKIHGSGPAPIPSSNRSGATPR
jgi:hypothetical protein